MSEGRKVSWIGFIYNIMIIGLINIGLFLTAIAIFKINIWWVIFWTGGFNMLVGWQLIDKMVLTEREK